jgi:MFS family permease
VQGVLGTGAVEAGLALGALTIGWPIAASLSGRFYLRIGFRDTALIGVTLAVVGAVLAARLTAEAQTWQVAAAMFVIGLGMGLSSSPVVVAVQSVVGWERRGVVTGANMFSRAIGSALGAAAFGAVANATLASRFADAPTALRGRLPEDVDGTAGALQSTGPVADYARESLHAASHSVFVATAVTAVAVAAAVALMPRRVEPLVFDD